MNHSTLMNILPFLSFCLLSALGCQAPDQGKERVTLEAGYTFPYSLDEPDETFLLPMILEEISGLDLSDDGKTLAAIQDENGILFLIDRHSGQVKTETEFWKDGDYEGVEFVGDTVYVVKSNGTLYEIIHPGTDRQGVKNHKNFLSGGNDVEGLAYDQANRRLLLACKGNPGHSGKAYPDQRAVYAFDLKDKELLEEPVFLIDSDSVLSYLDESPGIRKLEKLLEFFDPDEAFGFYPSAIAIHPLSGHLYISSSVGKMLIVLHTSGRIVHIEKLKKKIHPQPEGLCFDEQGTLFISSEGRGEQGRIHRFDYRP